MTIVLPIVYNLTSEISIIRQMLLHEGVIRILENNEFKITSIIHQKHTLYKSDDAADCLLSSIGLSNLPCISSLL